MSEGIAMEREGLVSELSLMKLINTKMVDERDTITERHASSSRFPTVALASELKRHTLNKKFVSLEDNAHKSANGENMFSLNGSTILNAEQPETNLERMQHLTTAAVASSGGNGEVSGDFECDDDYFQQQATTTSTTGGGGFGRSVGLKPRSRPPITTSSYGSKQFRRFHSQASSEVSLLDEIAGSLPTMDPSQPMPFPEINYTEEDSSDDVEEPAGVKKTKKQKKNTGGGRFSSNTTGPLGLPMLDSMTSATGLTSFGDDLTSFSTSVAGEAIPPPHNNHFVLPLSQLEKEQSVTMQNPERVYKVIFIGDASVGKTSLITRFCQGRYSSSGLRDRRVKFAEQHILTLLKMSSFGPKAKACL